MYIMYINISGSYKLHAWPHCEPHCEFWPGEEMSFEFANKGSRASIVVLILKLVYNVKLLFYITISKHSNQIGTPKFSIFTFKGCEWKWTFIYALVLPPGQSMIQYNRPSQERVVGCVLAVWRGSNTTKVPDSKKCLAPEMNLPQILSTCHKY